MSMQSQKNEQISAQVAPSPGNPATQKRSRRGWIAGVVVLLVFAGVLISGILERVQSSAALRVETTDMAVPTFSVLTPQRAPPLHEITLPFFFFNDTATPEIYTLSLHDALPSP